MPSLFATQAKVSFAVDLFDDLVRSQEWELLAVQARRHLNNPDAPTQVQARRVLAMALAHSAKANDKDEAVSTYRSLIDDGLAEAQDRGNLAALLLDLGHPEEAKAVVLQAITTSSRDALEVLRTIGQRIVGQTGDREFRKQLEAVMAERGGHECRTHVV